MLGIWRPSWIGVKSSYVLIWMMGADLPSNHLRDRLINPPDGNVVLCIVKYTVGIILPFNVWHWLTVTRPEDKSGC